MGREMNGRFGLHGLRLFVQCWAGQHLSADFAFYEMGASVKIKGHEAGEAPHTVAGTVQVFIRGLPLSAAKSRPGHGSLHNRVTLGESLNISGPYLSNGDNDTYPREFIHSANILSKSYYRSGTMLRIRDTVMNKTD